MIRITRQWSVHAFSKHSPAAAEAEVTSQADPDVPCSSACNYVVINMQLCAKIVYSVQTHRRRFHGGSGKIPRKTFRSKLLAKIARGQNNTSAPVVPWIGPIPAAQPEQKYIILPQCYFANNLERKVLSYTKMVQTAATEAFSRLTIH